VDDPGANLASWYHPQPSDRDRYGASAGGSA
jgi:hypothetical protein